MKRAIRRHHRRRLFKSRIKKLWWVDRNLALNDNEYLNKIKYLIKTPTPCSCTLCGNPRKHFRIIKKQEKIALYNMMEQCEESDVYTTLRKNNLPSITY